MGLGRAVMSKHLIADNKRVQIINGYSVYKRPVTLHYFDQPYYSRIMNRVLEELKTQAGEHL
ncbi:hypothetical protein D3C72_2586920 [compost metagenome]